MMIKQFNEVEVRDSAIVQKSSFDRIKALMSVGRAELAGEYAISVIEVALTGQCSSDDFDVQMYLKDFEYMAAKNKNAHDLKVQITREKKIQEQKLDIIAELLNQGLTQTEIAKRLNTTKQTISNRTRLIRTQFTELLDKESSKKSQVEKRLDGVSSSQENLLDKKSSDLIKEEKVLDDLSSKKLDSVSSSQEKITKEEKKLDSLLDSLSSDFVAVKKKGLTEVDETLDFRICQEVKSVKSNDNVNDNDNDNDINNLYSTSSTKACGAVSLAELNRLMVNFEWLDADTIKIKDTGKVFKLKKEI